MKRIIPFVTALLAGAALSACVTHHVHHKYPTWKAYKQAHPKARFVIVYNKPAPKRTCWRVRRGWRCVVQ